MPVFRLNPDATMQALFQPLAEYGHTPPSATQKAPGGDFAEHAWRATSGHPHFIQLLGDSLHEELLRCAPKTATIPEEALNAALGAFARRREKHHERRYGELEAVGLAEAAACVAQALSESNGHLQRHAFRRAAGQGQKLRETAGQFPGPMWVGDPDTAVRALVHRGFVWGGTLGTSAPSFGPGIPCLASYVLQRAMEQPHIQQALGGRRKASKDKTHG